MSQRIDKLHRAVTVPAIYQAIQLALGAHASRQRFVDEFLRPEAGMRLLDVGCGPATMLPYLPRLSYTGIDLNQRHIAYAQQRFPGRGTFICGDVTQSLDVGGDYDLVDISGLLHHIDDAGASALLANCLSRTKSGGRVVTIDPVRVPNQRKIAAWLMALDSGLQIRTPERYLSLGQGLGATLRSYVLHDGLRVPYDHFVMVLEKQ